jgi:integrative and conjugative element protein (TIGR02256 family)
MRSLVFWSSDSRFGLRLPPSQVKQLLSHCSRARKEETGGILVGYYAKGQDCAITTTVSGPPSDSKAGPTWFQRGVRGVQRLLRLSWRRERYFIGEWHFHPGAAPDPSGTDRRQMWAISDDAAARCPEPVLLIVGGCPPERWFARAFVFPRGDKERELLLEQHKHGGAGGHD